MFSKRFCVALAFGFVVFSTSQTMAEAIGKVAKAVGVSKASGPEGGDRRLKNDSDIFVDDRIVAGKGNVQIILNDGTKLVVGPESTLVISDYVGSGGTASSVGVNALRGTFRFMTGKSKKDAYRIRTAQATIGIRGTGFDFWVRDLTGVAVLQGVVNLGGLNGGIAVLLNSGCQLGTSSTTQSRRLRARAAAVTIRRNLPFILNQSSLLPTFQLPISDCSQILASTSSGGSVFEQEDQPGGDLPPPPPQNNIINGGGNDSPPAGGGQGD